MTPKNLETHFIAWPLAVICLIGCFYPVNFSDSNTNYTKLRQKKIEDDISKGSFVLAEKNKADKEIIRNKEQARVKLEQELAEYTSMKIYESQKILIEHLAEKWLTDTESEVLKNTEDFISNSSKRTIGIKRNTQEELDKYISERLKEKRLEFAEIIINKWAEEKKLQIKNDPCAFVLDS